MHKSKSEIAERTWNPITGCMYKCNNCRKRILSTNLSGDIRLNLSSSQCVRQTDNTYVLNDVFIDADTQTRLQYPFGFLPTYHRYRLSYPSELKNGYRIMVCEMGDMFGHWVPDEWINEIFNACKKADTNHYLFLTKNPRRYAELHRKGNLVSRKNFWYGVDITDDVYITDSDINIWLNIQLPVNVEELAKVLPAVKWVVLNAPKAESVPVAMDVEQICRMAGEHSIPIYMKKSMEDIVGPEKIVKDIPESLKKKYISKKVRKLRESECMACGIHLKKSQMLAICVRSVRGEMAKQVGHLCKDCFKYQLQEWNSDMPKLKAMEDDNG